MSEPDTIQESPNPEIAIIDAVSEYGASNIQVLKNAAHIRQNPGMYIGGSHEAGMHHLFYEVLHNSIDEAMAGHCRNIEITLHPDDSITIEDDGRGIPVEVHPDFNRSALELVMCEVGAGGKFNKDSYKISGGLHGMGVKAVNALSEWTTVQVRRDGKLWQQDYERGVPLGPVREVGPARGTGTKITFRPDPEPPFFPNCHFDYDTIEARLRELAFLNPNLTIKLKDERGEGEPKQDTFFSEGGVAAFLQWLNRADDAIHAPVVLTDTRDDIYVDVAIQYIADEAERVRGYSNNVFNPGGGTHVSGLRSALTRTINFYGSKQGLIKESINLVGEDFREGLSAIINIRCPHPQYNNQAKERLTTPEIEGVVSSVINEHLARYLEEHPQVAKKIVQKVVLAAEAREAAAKARKQLRDRKNILSGAGLPGKLMDCTSKDRDECELFMVEGESAGGSAASGRDSRYQAILPLKGKILNVEKARIDKMLANDEICNIISAVGTDIAEAEDTNKRNYDKIILLTDADVDGSHIRTLILTFLYRQMPKLVAEGHVYLAQPPLFRVIQKKSIRYVQTREEMERELLDRGLKDSQLLIAGPDGATLSNDRLRALLDVLTPLDQALQILERRGVPFTTLLTHARNQQLPNFRVFVRGVEHWFTTQAEVDAFCHAEAPPAAEGPETNGSPTAAAWIDVHELHEVRAISRGLERLKEFGFHTNHLLMPKHLPGVEPEPQFYLVREETKHPLHHLRQLLPAIRALGEKGMTITRFKGLGEMNPEELWETTLDPEKRTLMKVKLAEVAKADEMFRVLMGDKVEPRREFIEKHALEVRNLDV